MSEKPFIPGLRPLSDAERDTPRDLVTSLVEMGRELRLMRWRRRMRRYDVEGTKETKALDLRKTGESL